MRLRHALATREVFEAHAQSSFTVGQPSAAGGGGGTPAAGAAGSTWARDALAEQWRKSVERAGALRNRLARAARGLLFAIVQVRRFSWSEGVGRG